MTSTPPPDPYLALGVSKTATLAEIRSAHRKLVIKCHPDKVQDPTLKAIKQEEFHKVQQAYELLSDDAKRVAYDEQVKLAGLRKEMGRSGPSPSQGPPPATTVFDYEVREAAPRPSTFAKSKTKTEPTKVYTRSDSHSYEDDLASRMYEEPLRTRARKTTSYEEPRRSTREDEKRRRGEEEKLREKMEKEARKSARGSDKKSRDKERRRGTEEKHSTRASALHVTDEDSEELHRPAKTERKSSRRAAEEDMIRLREKEGRAAKEAAEKQAILTDRTRKLDRDKEFAAQYMSASRRKAATAAAAVEPEESFRPKPMRRAETFQGASYSSPRYAAPATYTTLEEEEQSDDEYVRRSSARSSQRRASEQVPAAPSRSTREASRPSNSRKASTAYDTGKPYIIDAGPPATAPLPCMPSHSSAPASLHNMVPPPPSRSRTMPAAYAPPAPPLGRAQTYQAGDSSSSRSRKSNLKKNVGYISEDSESSRSPSPPPVRRQPEPIRYTISKDSRAVPVASPRHRAAFKDDDFDLIRERSQSPRGTPARRSAERPPLTRSSGSGKASRSKSQGYYSTSPPEALPLKSPIIKEARPKLSARDLPSSSRNHTSVPYFGEVKYAPAYGPEHVMYSPDGYRRGSEPHQYTSPREATYA